MVLGENGFLGNGSAISPGAATLSPNLVPTPLGATPGTIWTAAAVGSGHTLALRSDGSLWAWGSNISGQLGIGSTMPSFSTVPVPVTTPSTVSLGSTWTSLAAADGMSFALRSDGMLWSWGATTPNYSALGHPAPLSGCFQPELVITPLGAPAGTRWTGVASGGTHTLGLRSDGSLWAWGSNNFGALGIGNASSGSNIPVLVPLPGAAPAGAVWQQIQAGPSFSQAILANGSLWAWGMNQFGQLGVNSGAAFEPFALQEYTQSSWSHLAAGTQHAVALSRGQVYVTGNGSSGQLGLGNAPNRIYFFVRVVGLPLSTTTAIANRTAVYPNPVLGNGTLYLSNINRAIKVQVVTQLGQVVLDEVINGSIFRLPNLPAGVYRLRLDKNNELIENHRLIIQ